MPISNVDRALLPDAARDGPLSSGGDDATAAARSLREWIATSRGDQRLIVLSAALMYSGAAVVGLIEGFVPGTPHFPITSGVVALAITVVLLAFGRRAPRRLLAVMGPLGVVLIAYALAHTEGHGDGAALYAWPVLWTAYFFDRRATVVILVAIGVAHAFALSAMPAGVGYPSRWIDVMVSMSVVAIVIRALTENNDELLARLSAEARVDLLTGLLNRRGLEERASFELEFARRDQLLLGAIAFDIDHFKRINDEHGHDTGDQVLSRIGAILREEIRGTDIAARTGGEEFLVLLTRSRHEEAQAIADRIRTAVSAASIAGVYRVTMSAGIAVSLASHDLEPLLRAADRALYRAKRTGRDRTVMALPDEVAQPQNRRLRSISSN